ncbi:rRNA maturation RNase YbeY [Ammonifex thiophilus]|uniref:Endoribonuclease YbeY n=1 Tax=Ammonifex thiophilus TaxID=444093 RepID=A0A3D8P7H7_9THEO|nr:rRNA maturation RNase YbeY [Ammonifex thiophilus]RDV84351.1 rRNA maturation RNase YbeY [Ammonifex thiophilus]
MTVIVQNRQEKVKVENGWLSAVRRAAELTLDLLGPKREVEVGITLLDDDGIRELNRRYRGKDAPTNVLAFPMGEEDPPVLLLGDVVISLETARSEAEEEGKEIEEKLAHLTVHGVLHLLGYDHETDAEEALMREKEEAVLAMWRRERAG